MVGEGCRTVFVNAHLFVSWVRLGRMAIRAGHVINRLLAHIHRTRIDPSFTVDDGELQIYTSGLDQCPRRLHTSLL